LNKILVTYFTHSGTTRDVADAIAEEIVKTGVEVEVIPCAEIKQISGYSAVVLGAPMIMGWHRSAFKFLRQHKAELAQTPLAIFVTAMSLTNTARPDPNKINIHIDEKLAAAPRNPRFLSFKENYTSIKNYTRPIVKAAPDSLVSIGLFGGRLDYYRLKWFEALFVMLIIGAKPGEKRNWPDIRAWAAGLPSTLLK
jgi:menaquinone-dependent protoporphyrinogen oxidase